MRVLETPHDGDLAPKPVGAERCGKLRVQHLERDLAPVFRVAGQIHGRHPTAPELTLEEIALAECRLQFFHRCWRHAIAPPPECRDAPPAAPATWSEILRRRCRFVGIN